MGFGFMNSLVYCPFISHFVASRASVMERVLFELRIQKTWSRHLLILWHCRPAAYSLWICKSGIILPAQYVSYGCEVKPMKYTWRYLVGFKKMYSGVVFICGGYLWFKRETSRLNSKKKKKMLNLQYKEGKSIVYSVRWPHPWSSQNKLCAVYMV